MSRAGEAIGKKIPLIGPKCQKTFLDQITLEDHIKKDHSLDPKPPEGVG
jgi:hypothetical protein